MWKSLGGIEARHECGCVARTAAGEVGKGLALHYMDNGRDHGLRIEIAAGSYIPQFRWVVEDGETAACTDAPAIHAAETPAGWEKKNIQVVISTEVVKGSSGPPKIEAAWFW